MAANSDRVGAFRHLASSARAGAALGIAFGLAATLFAVLNSLFLQYPAGLLDPAALRRVWVYQPSRGRGALRYAPVISAPDLVDLATHVRDHMPVIGYAIRDITGDVGAAHLSVRAAVVSTEYFRVLGVRFEHGGPWTPGDARRAVPVAVVSERLYRRLISALPYGERSAGGPSVRIGDRIITVVGVVSPPFAGLDPEPVDIWLPVESASVLALGDPWARSTGWLSVVARVLPGEMPSASRRLETAIAAIDAANPSFDRQRGRTVIVGSIRESRLRAPDEHAGVLFAGLLALTVLVLLIGFGNALILLTLDLLRQESAIATHVALGARPADVVLHRLPYATATVLAAAVTATISGIGGAAVVRAGDIAPIQRVVDPAFVSFTIGVAVLLLLALTVVPVRFARRVDVMQVLRLGAVRSPVSLGVRRGWLGLVALQLAITVISGSMALALGRGVRRAERTNFGFDPKRLVALTAHGLLVGSGRDRTAPRMQRGAGAADAGAMTPAAAMARLIRTVEHAPGVAASAWSTMIPFRQVSEMHQSAPDRIGGGNHTVTMGVADVDGAAFRVLGVRLIRGRVFDAADVRLVETHASASPVIISAAVARERGGIDGAIGTCLFERTFTECQRIIGVVEDANFVGVNGAVMPMVYQPLTMRSFGVRSLLVRLSGTRPSSSALVTEALERAGYGPEDVDVISVEALLQEQTRTWRNGALACTAAALCAAILGLVGVAGVAGYEVTTRARDLAVHRILGASPWAVVRAAGARTLWACVAGLVTGGVAAAATMIAVQHLIYGLRLDVLTSVLGAAMASLAVVTATIATRTLAGMPANLLLAVREG